MGIEDQELIRIFNEIEERLLEIQNSLSTPSVVQELEKYTEINTSKFLEIIELYLDNLDSLKKMSNKNLLKKLNEKLGDFISCSESEYYIKTYKLKLDKAFIFIKNQKNIFIAYLNDSNYKFYFLNSENSKLNKFITSMHISKFKQFTSFKIDFSEQINIIIGQNAIGKTTLLQAITLGLLKENSPDEETSYTKYISKGETSSEIIISHNNSTKVVKVLKSKREVADNYFIPFILAYGSNFFTNYSESDSIVQKVLSETIEEDFAHTIFLEHTDKFWNPLSVLRNLAISKHKTAKEKKKILFDTLNIFLEIEGYELISTNEEETRFQFKNKKEKTLLTLDELSEGYRGNVLLITDMIIKILGVGKTPTTIEGIVLIDEFDKHLHPRWQSKLVDKLTDTFPKIQFIMTTHNPMSILGRKADEITILEELDGQIEARKESGTENIDIGMVLLKYFNVDSIVGETMRNNLNEITEIKLKGRRKLTKEDRERIKELEEKLQYTPATDFIYNRAYFNFLVFLKEKKNIDFYNYESFKDKEMLELMKEYKEIF